MPYKKGCTVDELVDETAEGPDVEALVVLAVLREDLGREVLRRARERADVELVDLREPEVRQLRVAFVKTLPLASITTFSGFRSRYTIPFSCRYSSASSTCEL